MRGNEFLDKIELINPAYIEAADTIPKKKHKWSRWSAIAACLCLIVGTITIISHLTENQPGTQTEQLVLSSKTTAKVSYGYNDKVITASQNELEDCTEEEMFHYENMYVFRGKVNGLTNVTIDFNGMKEVRCIANIIVEKVYQGNLTSGEEIQMELPCAIGVPELAMTDTYTISHLENGMEGIFMPWIYDENSYMEMNGAVLMHQDLASCGLADGMRWAFLSTNQGLLFDRYSYPGAKDATNLNDIETYVIEMLK